MKKKTQYVCLLLVILGFLLVIIGCQRLMFAMECSGGIDGHTHTFSEEKKQYCREKFPDNIW